MVTRRRFSASAQSQMSTVMTITRPIVLRVDHMLVTEKDTCYC